MTKKYCCDLLECIDRYHDHKLKILEIRAQVDPKDYLQYEECFNDFENSKRKLRSILEFQIGEDFFKEIVKIR